MYVLAAPPPNFGGPVGVAVPEFAPEAGLGLRAGGARPFAVLPFTGAGGTGGARLAGAGGGALAAGTSFR